LKNLPALRPTKIIPNPTKDSPEYNKWERVFRMARSESRSADRARTYQGVADAMASQWGGLKVLPKTPHKRKPTVIYSQLEFAH
jgi:hypothetical protein